MTHVFVSHSSKDNYFVDFLIELLNYHRINVWVDRSDLKAGGVFTSDIEQALASCDGMLVVISQHSSKSRWITREISAFKARGDRPIIPLVLDASANPDEIYEGLGLVTQLRFYESFLESFRELLRLLDGTLFPAIENRKIPDRRSRRERRGQSVDRRKSSIERRLRVGMGKYIKDTGRDLLAPMDRVRDVGALAKLLATDNSPLKLFIFTDPQTGKEVHLDFREIESMAFASWYPKATQESSQSRIELESWGLGIELRSSYSETDEDMTGAAYIIDDIVSDLTNKYVVTQKEQRSQGRRQTSRRKDEQQSS